MKQRLVKPYSQEDLDKLTPEDIERGRLEVRMGINNKILVLEVEGKKTEWKFSLESHITSGFCTTKIPVKEPMLPIKLYSTLWHQEQTEDSPTLFAIDAENRCWMDNGYGGYLYECSYDSLIEAAETECDCNRIKRAMGKPEKVVCSHCHGTGWVD